MSNHPAPRLSRAALASFLLGLASVFLALLFITGLPALYLGLLGLRAVNGSDGRLRGRWMAVTGMVLGALGTLTTLVAVVSLVLVTVNLNSQRAECQNNLRLIGQGLNHYHELNETFPPAGLLGAQLAPERRLSWMAGVVPYLGEGKLQKRYEELGSKLDPDKAWDDPANEPAGHTFVRPFLCPAHPDFGSTQSPGSTSYLGIAGIDPDAINLPRSSARAGVFGYDRGVKRTEMTAGISFTMVATENAERARPWIASGPPTARGVDPNETTYIGPGRPFGGLHPGGANVLYGDASVRWIADTIRPETFRVQATLHGRLEP